MEDGSNVNWPGLLKWSLQYTDGTSSDVRAARSKEDFEFLEQAIKHALGNQISPAKIVKDAVAKLQEPTLTDEECLAALNLILECVYIDPEVSFNFDRLGATQALIKSLNHENAMVLESALQILAEALPNNDKIQTTVHNAGGLDILLNVTRSRKSLVTCESPQADELRLFARAFGCMAVLVKHPLILTPFILKGGFDDVLELRKHCQDPRIIAKADLLIDFIRSSDTVDQTLLELKPSGSSSRKTPEAPLQLENSGRGEKEVRQNGAACL